MLKGVDFTLLFQSALPMKGATNLSLNMDLIPNYFNPRSQ